MRRCAAARWQRANTAATPHNVDTVLVAGKVVKAGGRLVHADLRRTGKALRAIAARVTGR